MTRAAPRPSLAAIAIAVSALTPACQRAEPDFEPSPELRRLTGLGLAPGRSPGGGPLLFHRFEVTEAEYSGRRLTNGEPDLPAVFMTRDEAAAWAADEGMRLPTLAEWRYLAHGGRFSALYPWGPAYKPWVANTLDLGLNRRTPVGTFESGKTELAGYDFGGNVWEWVSDSPAAWAGAAACGGSFASHEESARVRAVRRLNPGDRAEDLGFRCVAEADAWFLRWLAPVWLSTEEEQRAGMRAVFATWDPGLRAELSRRLAARSAPDELCAALRDPRS